MKQFEVHYKGFKVINAESLSEANQIMSNQDKFMETTLFRDCHSGEASEVIGHCELSGLAIFEGDNYAYDNEGVMWLKEYATK